MSLGKRTKKVSQNTKRKRECEEKVKFAKRSISFIMIFAMLFGILPAASSVTGVSNAVSLQAESNTQSYLSSGAAFGATEQSAEKSDIAATPLAEAAVSLGKTIYYTVPAVFVNAGETVDLTQYSVMFNSSNTTPADKIAWSSGTAAVTKGKVAVTASGVTTVTATAGTQQKTIYIVAKKQADTEYVLYEKDFSTVSSWDELLEEGYIEAEKDESKHSATITAEGKLKLDGSTDSTGVFRVTLPWWLADFGDYTVETNVAITARQKSGRFWSISTRIQNGVSGAAKAYLPYTVYTIRDNLAAASSPIEITRKELNDAWDNYALCSKLFTTDIYQKGSYAYKLENYGTHVNAYVGETQVFDTEYPFQYGTGGIGFIVRGDAIEIADIKVTVDTAKVAELYDKAVREVNPAVLANAGDTIDLSEYSVTYISSASMCADHITWSSDEITVTNNTVTPSAAGVYTLKAAPTNMPKSSGGKVLDDMTTTVYLVVKEPEDTEYELFNIDYSTISDFTELTDMGYVVAGQPSGVEFSMQNGALLMAGKSSTSYARIMLPEWLGKFGNYSISADVKIVDKATDARYFSLIYRAQNTAYNGPHYVSSYRADTTASNGHDLNLAIPSSATAVSWKTSITATHNSRLDNGKVHQVKTSVFNQNVQTFIDGQPRINSDYIGTPGASYNYASGRIGYLVRAVNVEFYSTRVVLCLQEGELPIQKTDAVNSDVILPSSVITYVDDAADLDAIKEYDTAPATAIFRVDAAANVLDADGNVITSAETAIDALGKRVIPAFYVSDAEETDAIVSFIGENNLYDVFVVASDAALLQRAREENYLIRSVLDFSERDTIEDVYQIRKETNDCGARVCILPEHLANKATVEYLQRLFMAVWVTAGDTATDRVSSIVSGASGIITQNIDALVEAFTKYFAEGTMTRTVGVVGHQGALKLGQPNTVAGSMLAYELGATAIETDVQLSKDGVIMLLHDSTLDRETTGTGNLSAHTYAQLKEVMVDANKNADPQPMATLEDYFKAFKGLDLQIVVEIKTSDTAIAQKLADLITAYDMADQVNVIGFSGAQLLRLKNILPEVSVGFLYGGLPANDAVPEMTIYSMLEYTQKNHSTYNPSYSVGPLGPNVLRAALDRGIHIYPYTIDSESELSKYFMYGTHAITTNYPQLFTDLVKEVFTDQTAYFSTAAEVSVVLTTKTYGRDATVVTDASLQLVEGDDIFSYQNGVITASGQGSATLMFSYQCTGLSGKTYNVVTEPFTVTVKESIALLKDLQQHVKDIQNNENYCPTLYAAFDAARKLDADTLTEDEANNAIAAIKALGSHTWETEYTVDKEAALMQAGSKSIHCEDCDAINTETVTEIAAISSDTILTMLSHNPEILKDEGAYSVLWKWMVDPNAAFDFAGEDIHFLSYGMIYSNNEEKLAQYANEGMLAETAPEIHNVRRYSYAEPEEGETELKKVYKTYYHQITDVPEGKTRCAMAYIHFIYNEKHYEVYTPITDGSVLLGGLVGGNGPTIGEGDSLED